MTYNTEIVKEYDVAGKNAMSDVLLKRSEKEKHPIKDWFEYCIILPLRDWKWNVKWYIHNCKLFNKILWKWRDFDYKYQIDLLTFGLEQLADRIENGNEIDVTRNKKVKAIHDLIKELNTDYDEGLWDKFFDKCDENSTTHVTEYQDGSIGFKTEYADENEHKKALKDYESALTEAKKAHYQKIFSLIEGQNNLREQIKSLIGEKRDDETLEEYSKRNDEAYYEKFDGSGIEGWWD